MEKQILGHPPIKCTLVVILLTFTYMFPLQLANTEEFVDGALAGHLGEVLIR